MYKYTYKLQYIGQGVYHIIDSEENHIDTWDSNTYSKKTYDEKELSDYNLTDPYIKKDIL